MNKIKVFIAHSTGMTKKAIDYAKYLETGNFECYVPGRDTEQIHTTEKEILSTNLKAIKGADEMHVLWDLSSLGTIFDLGCAYALEKPIYIVDTKKHHWVKFILNNIGGRIL